MQHLESPFPPAQRRLHRIGQAHPNPLSHDNAVYHHLDRVGGLGIEADGFLRVQLLNLTIDANSNKSLPLQALQHIAKFSPLTFDHRSQHHEPRFCWQERDAIDDLGGRLAGHGRAGLRIMGLTQVRVEKPQVVVNLRGGRDGRARIGSAGSLLDGDGRRQPFDVVDLGLLHLVEELPCVGREALHVLALPFRKQRVEGQRRLPRTAGPRDDHQTIPWDLEREILEVVLPCPDDTDELLRHEAQATAGMPPRKPMEKKKGAGLATGPLFE